MGTARLFFFSSRRRHTRWNCDWSSDVCSSDLRTLDIGGDKALPYMETVTEENPALGWRAIRLGLDRPGLLRGQIRALLRAGGGRALRIMFPMISEVAEFDSAKAIVERELTYLRQHGHTLPERIDVGTMIEVPALLY